MDLKKPVFKLITNNLNILLILLFSTFFIKTSYAMTYNVSYKPSIDTLNFMDKLSAWEAGSASDAYLKYWSECGLKKEDDEKFLLDYKSIRKKYYPSISGQLFTKNNYNKDIIASSFYQHNHTVTALSTLRKKLNKND